MKQLPDGSDIANLDNYLASIERAKLDLVKINSDIKDANEIKAMLLIGNTEILKEKYEDIEKLKREAIALRQEANLLHSNNSILAEELEKQKAELIKDQQEQANNYDEFMKMVNQNSDSLKIKQGELEQSISEHNKNKADLENKIGEHNNNLKHIEEIRAEINISLENESNIKEENKALLSEVANELKNLKDTKDLLTSIKKEAHEKLSAAQLKLEESRINKSQSEELLNKAKELTSSHNDLILEGRKAKLEAQSSIEISHRKIIEANLKIAELNDLKEAMAKQEK